MKRRLRKKLHRAEFTEYGCDVRTEFAPSTYDDSFMDRLIAFVEARDLFVGGGCSKGGCDVFLHRYRGSVSEEERAEMLAWVEAYPGVTAVNVGPLVDAWAEPPAEGEAVQ